MKRIILLPITALIAFGCQDQQVQRGAEGVQRKIVRDSWRGDSGSGGEDAADRMLDEMKRDIERRRDYERGREDERRGWGMLSMSNRPGRALELTSKQAARAYGIRESSAFRLLVAVNDAAAGDFSQMEALGLTKQAMKRASRNQGRLLNEDLQIVSRNLGLTQAKTNQLMRHLWK